jgi:hypothetical protein
MYAIGHPSLLGVLDWVSSRHNDREREGLGKTSIRILPLAAFAMQFCLTQVYSSR